MCPDNTCAVDRVEVAEEAVEVSSQENKICSPEKKLLGNRRPSRKFERLYRIGEVIILQSDYYYGSPSFNCTLMNYPVHAWSKKVFIEGAWKGGFWDGVRRAKTEGRPERCNQAHCQEQSHRDGAGKPFYDISLHSAMNM